MQYSDCSSGGPHRLLDYPFCLECGALSPAYITRGTFAVELEDVASERIRSDVVGNLKSWFPDANPLDADKKLKSGPSILIRGVDEASAQRILGYLKAIKAPGRMVEEKTLGSWSRRLWSPGLGVGAVALVAALLAGGLVGALLIVAGLGAVATGAYLKGRRIEPIIAVLPPVGNDNIDKLADEYGSLIAKLSLEDAEALKSVTTTVFDIRRRLKSDSVAAVAAGGATGDLYDRLSTAIPAALHIARNLLSSPEEDRKRLRKQLTDLNDLAKRTAQWLNIAEEGPPRTPADLSRDLDEVTQRIDRILETVHTPVTWSSELSTARVRRTSIPE